MRYVNCELTIHDQKNIEYLPPYSPSIRGLLEQDDLTRLTIERLNYWVEHQENLCKQEELQLLGLHLYKFLFADEHIQKAFTKTYEAFEAEYKEEKEKLHNQSPALRLRLRLIFTERASSLAKWPWEFLYVPITDIRHGFFFTGERTELILTRFVPETAIARKLAPENQPLRIMVVFSQPDELYILDKDEVKDVIKNIQGLQSSRVIVTSVTNPTFNELRALIADPKTGLPHILHFIGHGEAGKIALVKSPDDADYDNDKKGEQLRWIPSGEIKALFTNHQPRLIFLSSCKGAAADSLETFQNTARDLVYAEIPAVIAMQYEISNADAGTFAKKFYEQIGEGKEIDEAVKAGRVELGTSWPAWQHRRFGTPVVYLQSKTAIITPDTTGKDDTDTSGSLQVKCQYFDECRRMVYPDRPICTCPLNRLLTKSTPASTGAEAVREAQPTAKVEETGRSGLEG